MIERGEKIFFKNGNSFADAVLNDLLKMYSDKGSVEIVKDGKAKKIAVSLTTDSEADEIVHVLVKGNVNKLKQGPVENIDGKTIIKPLYLFLEKEVLLYAKIKRLKFKIVEKKKDKLSLFVEDLEKKHPEIKQSIIGSYGELFG